MEGILQPSRSDGGWGLIRALGRVSRWEPTLGLSPSSSEWPHLPPFPSRSSRPGRRMHGAGRRLPWQRHHGNVTMATAPWQRGRDGTRPGDARCAALRSDRHDHGTEPGRDSEPVKLPGDSSHAGVSAPPIPGQLLKLLMHCVAVAREMRSMGCRRDRAPGTHTCSSSSSPWMKLHTHISSKCVKSRFKLLLHPPTSAPFPPAQLGDRREGRERAHPKPNSILQP
ncbi:uncharacterized protein LOC109363722 isoform X3 [Meleagris gallopavo]|uniref:uncharacterized protein LOC109363722 isoform X3 n=1 Tax=Meleagris gallopavo TaxID=9103 RepID=UPI0012ABA617|nr:uncharacterized protein LOC109363722 isoform X3 [Meleagris gallopavo]